MSDSGHESENFSKYGAQCVNAANLLWNLLPPGASITAAIPDENGAIKTFAVLTLGFTTANLVDELAIGIIIIGLGSSNDQHQLKHTLTHKGVSTLDAVLTELQKADNLVRSDGITVASTPLTSAGALATKGKKASFN